MKFEVVRDKRLTYLAPFALFPRSRVRQLLNSISTFSQLLFFPQVEREIIDGDDAGVVRVPEPAELGWKDTVIAYPGEVTRIKANFDIPGLYVWHW